MTRESAREAILEAKRWVAALPAYRREQLEADFAKAREAARFHANYVRPN